MACLGEIAWRKGYITKEKLAELAAKIGGDYGAYLRSVAENGSLPSV